MHTHLTHTTYTHNTHRRGGHPLRPRAQVCAVCCIPRVQGMPPRQPAVPAWLRRSAVRAQSARRVALTTCTAWLSALLTRALLTDSSWAACTPVCIAAASHTRACISQRSANQHVCERIAAPRHVAYHVIRYTMPCKCAACGLLQLHPGLPHLHSARPTLSLQTVQNPRRLAAPLLVTAGAALLAAGGCSAPSN